VYFLELVSGTTHLVKGFKVNRSGNLLWSGSILSVCSLVSGKGRLTGVLTQVGNSIVTWSDNRQDGNGVYAQELNFNGALGVITGVKEVGREVPHGFSLSQNYPNPFNPTTKIRFSLPSSGPANAKGRVGEGSHVLLKVCDLLGREVATLINEVLPSGEYEREFTAQNLASGVYIYHLTVGSMSESRTMMLLK
jgi:hypothetical protein